MIIMKKLKNVALMFIVGAFFCGCAAIEDALNINLIDDNPRYQISLHSIITYPRGNEIEEELDNFKGEKIVVNANSFLDSSKIFDAELIPLEDNPGYYDIHLKLNDTGVKQWFQLVLDYRDYPVAIVIDGAYFGRFRPDGGHTEDTQWVTLKGPFNELIARGIVKYARRNYRHYHPTSTF